MPSTAAVMVEGASPGPFVPHVLVACSGGKGEAPGKTELAETCEEAMWGLARAEVA
jgi:hypothetical protein